MPYYGYFLDNSIQYLAQFAEKKDEGVATEEELQLVEFILSSIYKCFLFDTDGFINKEKFDKLLPALVDQLEVTAGSEERYTQRMNKYLTPALVQLAVDVGNDVIL